MIRFDDVTLLDLLPSSINNDSTIIAIGQSLDKYMQENIRLRKQLDFLTKIDDIENENLLDALAYQFHVDFYDYDLDIQSKRNMVKTSVANHRKKGTAGGLTNVIKNIFPTANIEEWFEYDGEPYHFKIDILLGNNQMLDVDNMDYIYRLIDYYKNTRSWLEHLMFYKEDAIEIQEQYTKLPVAYEVCGHTKTKDKLVHSNAEYVSIKEEYRLIKNTFKQCGTFKAKDVESLVNSNNLEIENEYVKIKMNYLTAGGFLCGGGIL